MVIVVHFQFSDEARPAAQTGVEGQVTDLILPSVGDFIRHQDKAGQFFVGKVTQRIFEYVVPTGVDVSGAVGVTVMLDRVRVQ